ncbi:GH11341 [Drosophila grimshawi]|uniref:RING-type E3 ubiquitin transferase n=2 Tax=Drosophila grimshawi TaxID=7222 RepID=B4JEA8_DROGR|nr:GH11341 [Drosophila grimshawi]
MNRHENIVCTGCSKLEFTGLCYRCLSCQDFNLCAECYEHDFTNAEHPFDHPVKCVYTPADVEFYFGGEYLNDPPQSYRCPYCKQWGYNESTFLEHISAEHANASTLLVSTIITLFEQQQAVRLFLEDEQLAMFASTAKSRNELMNRNEGSLELYLEPLNPNGSYQRERQVTFRMDKPDAVDVADNVTLTTSSSNDNVDNNIFIPDEVRRQRLVRLRHRAQQQLNFDPSMPSSDVMHFTELLPTIRANRPRNVRIVTNQEPNPSSNGRNMTLVGFNGGAARTRTQRHRPVRMQLEGRPASAGRMHVERLRGGPGAGLANITNAAQRLFELSELSTDIHGQLERNMRSGAIMLNTIDEEEVVEEQCTPDANQLEQESERFLCYRFLSTASVAPCPHEEQSLFLAQRAEFVAQLFASVLCEEELTSITPPLDETKRDSSKLRKRSAGAGDWELNMKRTK